MAMDKDSSQPKEMGWFVHCFVRRRVPRTRIFKGCHNWSPTSRNDTSTGLLYPGFVELFRRPNLHFCFHLARSSSRQLPFTLLELCIATLSQATYYVKATLISKIRHLLRVMPRRSNVFWGISQVHSTCLRVRTSIPPVLPDGNRRMNTLPRKQSLVLHIGTMKFRLLLTRGALGLLL